MFLLFHFQSISLLMTWEGQQRWPRSLVFGLNSQLLALAWPYRCHLEMNQYTEDVSLSLTLYITLTFQKTNI